MQQVIENPQPIGNLMNISICFKVRGPFVETFVLKKNHILTPFNVQIASNYAFLFRNKENKILLGPPPPPKKKGSGIQTVAIWLYAQVFIYTSRP